MSITIPAPLASPLRCTGIKESMTESSVPAQYFEPPRPDSKTYHLTVRQHPERAKAYDGLKERDRKPVDPPPIVQLQITDPADPGQNYLQNPYFFICCTLVDKHFRADAQVPGGRISDEDWDGFHPLQGGLVSSLHRLKDFNNTDAGFFVFPDVICRLEGNYRLRFSLFEITRDPFERVVFIKAVTSEAFMSYSPKNFPGMLESTFLSRSFSDQGVRLRVRKEPRILGKRPAQADLPLEKPSGPPSSRSLSRHESSEVPSPQGGAFPSSFPNPATGSVQGPGLQTTLPQGGSYSQYPTREPSRSRPGSIYSTDLPGEYLASQQRIASSFAPAGMSSQGSNWLGGFQQPQHYHQAQYSQQHHGRASGLQYPYRELGGAVSYSQTMSSQLQQPSQYPQPVAPERQLPSSGHAPYDYQAYDQTRRQDTYGAAQNYNPSYDERQAYGQAQGQATPQDPYTQVQSRALPAPPASNGGHHPTNASASSTVYTFTGSQQAGATNPPSGGQSAGTQGYSYGPNQGQQGYR